MEGRGMFQDNRGMGRNAVQEAVQVNWDHGKKLIPVLYDWFAHHSFVWPSLSCRWGRQVEKGTYRNRQHLYLSEQTDGTDHNTLLVMTVGIVKTRVASADHIAKFDEEARSPFVLKSKTIIHPGEVNRVRELPQRNNIVATHTDKPYVFIWDVETQPNRQCVPGANTSSPDLTLVGHQDIAEFALAMCPMEPFVLSGGTDKSVVLWNINDHTTSLAADQGVQKSPGYKGDTTVDEPAKTRSSEVSARGIFQGHEDTVEDVQFNPSSAQEFCSVGDDSCLILWDARTGSSPVVKVEKAHDADLHCVDWNPNDVDQLLTGSADNTIRMFDRRKLTSNGVASPIYVFASHTSPILCVQWSPAKKSVFGSSADDGILNIWDYEKIGKKDNDARPRNPNYSPGLLFRHGMHGCRTRVVDFHWNPADPWTIASVAQGGEENDRGGSLQVWRMIDFLYRPKEEVIAELEKLKSHIPSCSSS